MDVRTKSERMNIEWLTKLHDNELIGAMIELLVMNDWSEEESNTLVFFFTGLIHAKQKFIKNYLVDRFDYWNLFIDIVNFIAGEIE